MTREKIPPRALNTGLGLGAIVLWSTTVALGRSLSEDLGPLTATSAIYFAGGAMGYGTLLLTGGARKVFRSSPRYLLGCGGLFVLYLACLYGGLGLAHDRGQAIHVGLVNYLWPMLTLLLSVPILGMKPTALLPVGAIVATSGIFFAGTQGVSTWQQHTVPLAPYLLGVGAALSWALYSNLSRRWTRDAQANGVPLFMLATGLALGAARLAFPEPSRWSSQSVLELAFMAISANLAYMFWERAMQGGDMILVASASYLTPLLSTIVSMIYLGVEPGWRFWAGCALVMAGAIACKIALREPPTPSRESHH